MKKNKRIVVSVIVFAFILLIATISNAAEVKVEKVVPSTDGGINFIFSELSLESGANYQWAIEKSQNVTITNWYDVLAPEYDTGTVKVSVLSTNANHLEILKSTDTAYITIRKVGETTNLLDAYQVDLTLPLLKAYTYVYVLGQNDDNVEQIKGPYGMNNANISYMFEKIEDANIVNKYIDNNHDLTQLELAGIGDIPNLNNSQWKTVKHTYAWGYVTEDIKDELNLEDGLYYLWLKGSDTGVKTVYGQAIIEVGTVTKITSTTDGGKDTTEGNNENKETPKTEQQTSTTGKTDSTIANKILPNTGISIAIVGTILLVTILGIGALAKYYTYKDVK